MEYIGFVLMAVYLAIAIFVLTLLSRFVTAHEKVARALEAVAHQLRRQADSSEKPKA